MLIFTTSDIILMMNWMLSGVGCIGVLSFSFSFFFFFKLGPVKQYTVQAFWPAAGLFGDWQKKEKAGELTDLKITWANSCNPVAF